MTTENWNAKKIGVSMEGLTLRVMDVERSLSFYKMIPGVEEIALRPGGFALLTLSNDALLGESQPFWDSSAACIPCSAMNFRF